jgi:hypothetical protein
MIKKVIGLLTSGGIAVTVASRKLLLAAVTCSLLQVAYQVAIDQRAVLHDQPYFLAGCLLHLFRY